MQERMHQLRNNPQELESYYQSLSFGEKQEFAKIIQKLHDEEPDNSLLKGWFYRLEQKPSPAFKANRKSVVIAVILGWLAGLIVWTIHTQSWRFFPGFTGSFLASLLTIIFCFSLFAIFNYSPRKYRPWPIIISGLPLFFFTMGSIFFDRGQNFVSYQQFFLFFFSLFAVFMLAAGFSGDRIQNTPSALSKFGVKLTEVVLLSMLFTVPAIGLVAAVFGLIGVAGITVPGQITMFIVSTVMGVGIGLATAFAIDTKYSLSEQPLSFLNKGVLRINLVLATIVTIFLTIYAGIIVPVRLVTVAGNSGTAASFLGFLIINFIFIFFLEQLQTYLFSPVAKIYTRIVTYVLLLLSILMGVLGLYNVVVRILDLGITLDRAFVVFFLILSTLIFGSYLLKEILILILNRPKASLYGTQLINLAAFLCVAIFMFVTATVVDLEYISLERHYERYSMETSLSKHLDRNFVRSSGSKAAEFLQMRYRTASVKNRADIILTLRYWYVYDYGYNTQYARPDEVLEQIAETEQNPYLAAMAKAYADKKTNNFDICEKVLPGAFPGEQLYTIKDFCSGF